MVCKKPTATMAISMGDAVAKGKITTKPGNEETITNATLFIYNGERYVQRTDIDLTGAAKTVEFEWPIIVGGIYYHTLLLTNSCGESSGWLKSKEITEKDDVDNTILLIGAAGLLALILLSRK